MQDQECSAGKLNATQDFSVSRNAIGRHRRITKDGGVESMKIKFFAAFTLVIHSA